MRKMEMEIMYCIKKLLHPDIFQGRNKKKRYFEGWYFRFTDSKGEKTYAVIPGVSIGKWDTHAFIQVLDDKHKEYYFHYELSDFAYNEDKFEIMIGDNFFSKSRMKLNLISSELSLMGDLYFCNILEYPRSVLSPGVMGPFLLDPCMECYHDIINIQHEIIGHLKIAGKKVDFTNGIGYIEKDWGRSMPSSWIWFQSNHFQPDNVSLSISVAKIPMHIGSFTGFIGMFRYKDRIFMFTTYNGSKIQNLYRSKNKIRITFKDCRFRLDIIINYAEGGSIKAPVEGLMSRSITECIDAVVKVRFSDRHGCILYEGIGTNGGFELVEEK
jgi:hypothetical protein